MAAPQPPPPFAPDLPAIDLLERSMPRLVAVPPARAPRADRAARIGLVLSVVLALVGAVCAVGRSGDDTTSTTNGASPAVHEPDPTSTTITGVPSAVVPTGFHLVTGPDVSLVVPEDWTTMDPAELHMSKAQLRSLYPDLDPDLLEAATAAAQKGAIFMAVDTAGEGRGRSVNVLTIPGELPLDQMDDVIAGVESSGIEVKETAPIDHPLGPAFRISYGLKVAGLALEGVQVWVPVDGVTYVVTVTASTPQVADQILQSFRVDDSTTA
jgi:hypothetical protein